MNSNKILLIVSIIMLVIGIGLIISPIGGEAYYLASGKLALNDTEWEQFKISIYEQPNVTIDEIDYLDSGELKIVSFDTIEVSEDFAYGEVIKHFDKKCDRSNILGVIIAVFEAVFTVLGIILLIFWFAEFAEFAEFEITDKNE